MERWTNGRLFMAAVMLVGVYLLAQGLLRLSSLWMLVFGSVVVAVVIRALADPLVRRARLRNGLAVAASVLIIIALLTLIGFLFGREIEIQIQQLAERLPAAWDAFQTRLASSPASGWLVEQAQSLASSAGRALAIAPRIAMEAASALTTLVLVLVAGVFLATQPQKAREGVLALAPLSARPRLREVMDASGRALKGWLRAQLISMVLVGTVTTIGLALIGVPAPLALGLFTGLAQFVPIVGPIASAVPALLVAATGGSQMLWLTVLLYVGVSQLEANLIHTPRPEKRGRPAGGAGHLRRRRARNPVRPPWRAVRHTADAGALHGRDHALPPGRASRSGRRGAGRAPSSSRRRSLIPPDQAASAMREARLSPPRVTWRRV
ncbi:AI-2E family transporter [Phenylobacterium sp. J426]|uniref:AI-2E family transporter n=1 Tax=Phenylobacterium sp. J426 TaxID=2898439 RepID=UPI002150903D|nr:AI-2E family transporter [Phenylobacterium sp. J426]MCR5872802.1 AI-2E family transporter [Phenylobacterium sp. J426]